MTECVLEDVVEFVFANLLTEEVAIRIHSERAIAAAKGYALGRELSFEEINKDTDYRLHVTISPTEVADFQDFMDCVDIEPDYIVCNNTNDTEAVKSCGWIGAIKTC